MICEGSLLAGQGDTGAACIEQQTFHAEVFKGSEQLFGLFLNHSLCKWSPALNAELSSREEVFAHWQ